MGSVLCLKSKEQYFLNPYEFEFYCNLLSIINSLHLPYGIPDT